MSYTCRWHIIDDKIVRYYIPADKLWAAGEISVSHYKINEYSLLWVAASIVKTEMKRYDNLLKVICKETN